MIQWHHDDIKISNLQPALFSRNLLTDQNESGNHFFCRFVRSALREVCVHWRDWHDILIAARNPAMNRDMKEMTAFVRKHSISHVLTIPVNTLRTTKNNNTRFTLCMYRFFQALGWHCELWLESWRKMSKPELFIDFHANIRFSAPRELGLITAKLLWQQCLILPATKRFMAV